MIRQRNSFTSVGRGLAGTAAVALCLASVPVASQLALLIFGIEPNPRHLPEVMTAEVTGWGVIGLIAGAFSVIITETAMMQDKTAFWVRHRPLILGGAIGVGLAILLSVAVANVQMGSLDAQAVTSSRLGLSAALVVGLITGVAGVVLGAVLKRFVNYLAA